MEKETARLYSAISRVVLNKILIKRIYGYIKEIHYMIAMSEIENRIVLGKKITHQLPPTISLQYNEAKSGDWLSRHAPNLLKYKIRKGDTGIDWKSTYFQYCCQWLYQTEQERETDKDILYYLVKEYRACMAVLPVAPTSDPIFSDWFFASIRCDNRVLLEYLLYEYGSGIGVSYESITLVNQQQRQISKGSTKNRTKLLDRVHNMMFGCSMDQSLEMVQIVHRVYNEYLGTKEFYTCYQLLRATNSQAFRYMFDNLEPNINPQKEKDIYRKVMLLSDLPLLMHITNNSQQNISVAGLQDFLPQILKNLFNEDNYFNIMDNDFIIDAIVYCHNKITYHHQQPVYYNQLLPDLPQSLLSTQPLLYFNKETMQLPTKIKSITLTMVNRLLWVTKLYCLSYLGQDESIYMMTIKSILRFFFLLKVQEIDRFIIVDMYTHCLNKCPKALIEAMFECAQVSSIEKYYSVSDVRIQHYDITKSESIEIMSRDNLDLIYKLYGNSQQVYNQISLAYSLSFNDNLFTEYLLASNQHHNSQSNNGIVITAQLLKIAIYNRNTIALKLLKEYNRDDFLIYLKAILNNYNYISLYIAQNIGQILDKNDIHSEVLSTTSFSFVLDLAYLFNYTEAIKFLDGTNNKGNVLFAIHSSLLMEHIKSQGFSISQDVWEMVGRVGSVELFNQLIPQVDILKNEYDAGYVLLSAKRYHQLELISHIELLLNKI